MLQQELVSNNVVAGSSFEKWLSLRRLCKRG